MLFVLNDMREKEVSYTSYEYDENYNRTEVTKTKKDFSPEFTITIGSKNTELLEKMADIGIKYKLLKKEQDFYDISLPRKTPFGLYAIMGTSIFRTVRRILPGPYTIVLEASAEVPRDMRNRHGEIGLRMPDLALCRMLVELLGEPVGARIGAHHRCRQKRHLVSLACVFV